MRRDNQPRHSLVFLHGFPFNSKSWVPQVAYVEQNFGDTVKTFAPNLRGHRPRLPTENTPWMLQHFVADLERYLDQSHIEKAVLCGLSMGGYVALRFVADHSDRVEGLILADTRADADTNEAKQKRYELIEKLQREGAGGFAKDFSKLVLSETTLAEKPEIRAQIEATILGHDPKDLALVVGALASRPDSSEDLAAIGCPTLVIVGRDDQVTPVKFSEVLAEKIPQAQLQIIERAGHLSNVEQPDAFNKVLGDFLSNKLLGRVFEKNRIEVVKNVGRNSPN